MVDAFHAALDRGDTAAAAGFLSDALLVFEGGGVERSKAEKEALKQQKKAEAAERKKKHEQAVARRKATDILYLGRGVSKGLADRRANVEKLQAAGLPVLATPADVATALGLTIPKLRWLAFHAEAATRMSIPVPRVLVSTYVLCGGLAGTAGVLLAGNIGGASATVGQSAGGLLDAIAAVIIGGASILGGRGSVWNCLIGALLIGVIRNGLALVGASPFLQGLLVGATILVAVQLDVVRTWVERRIRTIQANGGAL